MTSKEDLACLPGDMLMTCRLLEIGIIFLIDYFHYVKICLYCIITIVEGNLQPEFHRIHLHPIIHIQGKVQYLRLVSPLSEEPGGWSISYQPIDSLTMKVTGFE